MPLIYGIDVSKHQGVIDWRKVKGAGKNFVFVRLGWAGWNGEINVDSMALTNIKGASEAGLYVGIYVYSYCKTPEAARLAAQETLKLIEAYTPLHYPIAFDIEDTSLIGTPYNTFGKTINNSIVTAFLDEIENAGFYGMLYTYKSFAENYLDMRALKKYDLWIAQYASKCTYASDYGIWQYAGDDGRCDGVPTACDLNVAYKNYADIIKSAGLNGHNKQTASYGASGIETENEALRKRVQLLEEKLKKIAVLSYI